jgi:menaquinol-cytochrome c reductase iron-sulfur subunit
MDRRTFLRWGVHGLGAVFSAVLGVPAVIYLIDPRNRPVPERNLRPIGTYKELQLQTNVPKEIVIRATRQDAWTLHTDEVVGRVWLVLREEAQGQRPPTIEAFNTTCPHLGCAINFTGTDFLCPCHGAHYTLAGEAIRHDAHGPIHNPAPRHMDSLQTEVQRVPGSPDDAPDYTILVKYQKFQTNNPQKEPLA